MFDSEKNEFTVNSNNSQNTENIIENSANIQNIDENLNISFCKKPFDQSSTIKKQKTSFKVSDKNEEIYSNNFEKRDSLFKTGLNNEQSKNYNYINMSYNQFEDKQIYNKSTQNRNINSNQELLNSNLQYNQNVSNTRINSFDKSLFSFSHSTFILRII